MRLLLAFCALLALFAPCVASAQGLPTQFVPSEVEALEGYKETLEGERPGLIYFPTVSKPVQDIEYLQSYSVTGGVYCAEWTDGKTYRYSRRFLIHAIDPESLPFAKRVAKTLLLLHATYRDRFKADHPRNTTTLDVWLMGRAGGLSADAGGRQVRDNIYLFNIFTERSPAEWLREIAHEYGHYIFLGVSGFTAPEAWGNGVLGERLFPMWLQEDVKSGKIGANALPFVTPEELAEQTRKQVEPLVLRLAAEGAKISLMQRRDAQGMDYFTAVALYINAVNGAKALKEAFSYTESADGTVFVRSPDFLRGVQQAFQEAETLSFSPPRVGMESFSVYLPKGVFKATTEGGIRSWEFLIADKGLTRKTANTLTVKQAGWRKLTLRVGANASSLPRLILHRQGDR